MMIDKNKLETVDQVIWKSGRAIAFVVFVCAIVFMIAVNCVAETDHKGEKSEKGSSSGETRDGGNVGVRVENFGKVTDFLYRGAQPKEDDYNQLAAMGIRTVIDLRNDPKDYAKPQAEHAGLRYVNIPMSDKDYPSSESTNRFLSLVNNQENWPIFVHCAGGRHRTGAMTAVYRMSVEGWDINRAYEEMKEYDFYTRWGHKAMKQYVFDYYRELLDRKTEKVNALNK